MGDLQSCPPERNGTLTDANLSLSPSLPPSNPHPSSISDDIWRSAEDAACDIIRRFQPTIASERKRNAIIDHVQRLIKASVGGEVFPFGSVPLKTYLPDGDIDLTTLSDKTAGDDALAKSVISVLEREEKNEAAEFEVKDIRSIKAEVQLVKCVVQNIIVDISFNQLGGLCTLHFLEKVDCLIGKDHLFKRSVLLIKAWCYYESRILGAHHNLISTYALETMVLYIFNHFHLSLHGPLGVLYKFLDYFSKFDWDNFCLSINGPVSLASLPEIVALENGRNNLILSKEFLQNCLDELSVPSGGVDNSAIPFSQKHFNIVDPLKESNNLGRSVNKGNFYRIRSAFTYGALMLGQILLLPGKSILGELTKFFVNTLERHQSRLLPDAHGSCSCYKDVMLFGCKSSGIVSSVPKIQDSIEDKVISESFSVNPVTQSMEATVKDVPHQSIRLKTKMLQHSSGNAVSPKLYFPPAPGYYLEDCPFTYSTCRSEKMPKLQQTGTYVPVMNHHSYQLGKAMNPSQLSHCWLPRPHSHINGDCIYITPVAKSTPNGDCPKPPCVPVSEVPNFCRNGKGKHSGQSKFIPTSHQNRQRFPFSSVIQLSSVDRVKFGTSGTSYLSAKTLKQQRQQDQDSGAKRHVQWSGSLFQMPAMSTVKQERASPPYCLNDEDFPPLPVCSREGGKRVQIKG